MPEARRDSAALLRAYRARELSPCEVVDAALARIAACDPRLNAFVLVEFVRPDSFNFGDDVVRDGIDFNYVEVPLYLSFVTLTTLGYGEITPVGGMARMLCVSEAVAGQIFLAVLVARLVGLQIAQERFEQRK